ncbi:AAA family ATPase [Streptococcus suis]|uniref:Predicted ATP-binding protein involved in virulence n=2 Tax=Streptococcus suis TaxID=1307 RepID=A0A0Z8LEH8_STRSU|nr:AAA family ATPase [Streptococcus suis]MCK3959215.1 AAA family ATPase [Streptococcus suis]NQG75914.1 AAA family ATPase [Streptococcus suis]NQG79664.1 AAA family ATPase [Streptococcus suis]CYV89218.1 Predicted ATP-binding protein involved in virulence [Streptococcus suis]CYV93806.1 Predicted ATP-binding protein involved in virulence [Streptococcus suis]
MMEFNYYLPKIKRLTIENFDLYNCPLEIEMSDKLNVIFGTNGLGKTTLLNIIQYSIIGPYTGKVEFRNYKDQQKSKRPVFDKDYFRSRMQIPSEKATVEVEFTIAGSAFLTRHSLYSHRLICFSVDGVDYKEKEKELDYDKYEKKYFSSVDDNSLRDSLINKYHEALIKASLFPDINSFILMLTEIMFFSESRHFTFWDENLSKLVLSKFMPRDKYFEYNETQKLIKKYDSQSRLKSYKMSMVKDFLGDDLTQTTNKEKYTIRDLEKIESKIKLINNRINENKEILNRRNKERVLNRAEVDKIRTEIAELDKLWYENIFPDSYQEFYDKFVPVINSGICPFCGTEHIESDINILKCFYCKSEIDANSEIDLTTIEIAQKNLQFKNREFDLRYGQIKKEIENIKDVIKNNELELFEATTEQIKIKKQTDLTSNDNMIKYRKLEQEKEKYLELLEKEKQKEARLANDIDKSIKKVFKSFSEIFYKYAHSFLGDDTEVRLELVGKGENTLFKFYLNNSPRESAMSLSESQRIFVDMAFRLSTLEFFHKDTYFMSETPDSTLDYFFEGNAVETFNSYLKSGNTLFLSANARNSSLVNLLIEKNKDSVNFINLLRISRLASNHYDNIDNLDIYQLLRR